MLINVVFDGPPSHESGRFVEVEDEKGRSINFGEWVERPDGYWSLQFENNRELVFNLRQVIRNVEARLRALLSEVAP